VGVYTTPEMRLVRDKGDLVLWIAKESESLCPDSSRKLVFTDDSQYYYEVDNNRNCIRVGGMDMLTNGRKMYWSYPLVRRKEKELDTLEKQQGYLKQVYDQTLTCHDYDAVLNHGHLMRHGGVLRGENVAAVNFRNIPRALMKVFYLRLGNKKLLGEEIPVEERQEVPVPQSTMGVYREKCVDIQNEAYAMGLIADDHWSEQQTYENKAMVRSYYCRTVTNRLDDAKMIMVNLNELNLIIPGDGYGVFSQMAIMTGKTVVSGDKSEQMVQLAQELGTDMKCETAQETILRGIEQFGRGALIFIAFLNSLVPGLMMWCVDQGYRILVYERYPYYSGSSKLREYGSKILRGVEGINWRGCILNLHEERFGKVKNPMLTQIVRGPIYIDSIRFIFQIAIYSESYPGQIVISRQSNVPVEELEEASRFHGIKLVDDDPKVAFVRSYHNARQCDTYDADTWVRVPMQVTPAHILLGAVDRGYLEKLMKYVKFVGPLRKGKRKKKNQMNRGAVLVDQANLVPNGHNTFVMGQKYYISALARLVPYVKPIYKDKVVQLVWLKTLTYKYVIDKGKEGYQSYVLTGK